MHELEGYSYAGESTSDFDFERVLFGEVGPRLALCIERHGGLRAFRAKVARNQQEAPHAARQARVERWPHEVQRYRRADPLRGMKLRVWVADPTRPEFAKEAARQAQLLRGRPEEEEALAFIEAAFPWPDE